MLASGTSEWPSETKGTDVTSYNIYAYCSSTHISIYTSYQYVFSFLNHFTKERSRSWEDLKNCREEEHRQWIGCINQNGPGIWTHGGLRIVLRTHGQFYLHEPSPAPQPASAPQGALPYQQVELFHSFIHSANIHCLPTMHQAVLCDIMDIITLTGCDIPLNLKITLSMTLKDLIYLCEIHLK